MHLFPIMFKKNSIDECFIQFLIPCLLISGSLYIEFYDPELSKTGTVSRLHQAKGVGWGVETKLGLRWKLLKNVLLPSRYKGVK